MCLRPRLASGIPDTLTKKQLAQTMSRSHEIFFRILSTSGEIAYGFLLGSRWLDFCQLSGKTGFDDVEQLNVPHIYWANYFGPDYVSKLGREHVMSAPAWAAEPLDDGGILYILGSGPGVVCEDHVAMVDVQQHFGLESVR